MTTATAPEPAAPGTAAAVPLREAAARMGMTTETLRKRLQRGLTPGRKVDGQWFVVPGPVPDASRPGPDQTGHVRDRRDPQAPAVPQERPGGPLASQRAEEMAAFTERLQARVRVATELEFTLSRLGGFSEPGIGGTYGRLPPSLPPNDQRGSSPVTDGFHR
jgi:hypothetical protein